LCPPWMARIIPYKIHRRSSPMTPFCCASRAPRNPRLLPFFERRSTLPFSPTRSGIGQSYGRRGFQPSRLPMRRPYKLRRITFLLPKPCPIPALRARHPRRHLLLQQTQILWQIQTPRPSKESAQATFSRANPHFAARSQNFTC